MRNLLSKFVVLAFFAISCGGVLARFTAGEKNFRLAENLAHYIFTQSRKVCVPPRRFPENPLTI